MFNIGKDSLRLLAALLLVVPLFLFVLVLLVLFEDVTHLLVDAGSIFVEGLQLGALLGLVEDECKFVLF
jgi:hypothetical protein